MTKKEHLLAVRPTIEYDVFSDILNDVLKAMDNYTNAQLNQDITGNLICGYFNADQRTSSATKCTCGREKWEHPASKN
jgi:hypothetical protein